MRVYFGTKQMRPPVPLPTTRSPINILTLKVVSGISASPHPPTHQTIPNPTRKFKFLRINKTLINTFFNKQRPLAESTPRDRQSRDLLVTSPTGGT